MARRHFHYYKKEFGGFQKDLILLYHSRGKDINEIQELLKCPRPSIRRVLGAIRRVEAAVQ
jgi:hypothetical protein